MMLQKIISQSGTSKLLKVAPIELKLLAADLLDDSFYWFNAYKTSGFPGVTIDKDYFFLRSTNHDANNGGIYLGKGNNLDLSDYEEVGLIFDGYQAETPVIHYDASHVRPIHLYYHTDASDPSNSGIQQTRLKTTSGGDLLTSTWTQETNPLGIEAGDQHTGYFNLWNSENSVIGIHYKKGINEETGFIGEQQYSTKVSGSWVRGGLVDTTSTMPTNTLAQASFGCFFKKFERWWWVGFARYYPQTTPLFNKMYLFRSNSSFELVERLQELEQGGSPMMRIEGDTMHIYFSATSGIRYTTLNLNDLRYYL